MFEILTVDDGRAGRTRVSDSPRGGRHRGEQQRTLGRVGREQAHLLPVALVLHVGLTTEAALLLELLLGEEEGLCLDLDLVLRRRDRDRVLHEVRDERRAVEKLCRVGVVVLVGDEALVPPLDVGRRRPADLLGRVLKVALQSRLLRALVDAPLEVLEPRLGSDRLSLADKRPRLLERKRRALPPLAHVRLARHARRAVPEALVEEGTLLERLGARVRRGRDGGRGAGGRSGHARVGSRRRELGRHGLVAVLLGRRTSRGGGAGVHEERVRRHAETAAAGDGRVQRRVGLVLLERRRLFESVEVSDCAHGEQKDGCAGTYEVRVDLLLLGRLTARRHLCHLALGLCDLGREFTVDVGRRQTRHGAEWALGERSRGRSLSGRGCGRGGNRRGDAPACGCGLHGCELGLDLCALGGDVDGGAAGSCGRGGSGGARRERRHWGRQERRRGGLHGWVVSEHSSVLRVRWSMRTALLLRGDEGGRREQGTQVSLFCPRRAAQTS